MSVALTILAQLGGNRFVAMTGAHSLASDTNALSFRLRSNPKRIAAVKVTLTPEDLYDVTFYRRAPFPECVKVVAERSGIYCDQLRDVFETETGLLTSL